MGFFERESAWRRVSFLWAAVCLVFSVVTNAATAPSGALARDLNAGFVFRSECGLVSVGSKHCLDAGDAALRTVITVRR